MKKIVLSTIFAAATAASLSAASLAACAGCHGADFSKAALGKSKIIKDMPKAEFVAALKGYQDGTYGGAMKNLMVGQVKGLDEATIQALADQIAK